MTGERSEKIKYHGRNLLKLIVRRSIAWLIRRLVKVGAKIAYHSRRWNVHITSAFQLAHHPTGRCLVMVSQANIFFRA